MSPEQVRGQQSDLRSDFFSLGAMLYEMLAGRPPFEGESAVDVMHAIVHKDAPPLPDSIPEGLQTIVFRCLEKKPAQRFQSAARPRLRPTLGDQRRSWRPALDRSAPAFPLALGLRSRRARGTRLRVPGPPTARSRDTG